MSIAELAIALEMNPATLRRYTRHEVEPKIELAERIAAFFNVNREYVWGDAASPEPVLQKQDPTKIPVYGAAQGGEGFDVSHVEGPVDQIARPPYLADAKDPYGVFVVGDSMESRFFVGEIVIVHPGLPVRRGGWCVAQFRAGDEVHAIVKRYRSLNDEQIVLEQLNPATEIRFKRADLVAIHRVVGIQITGT